MRAGGPKVPTGRRARPAKRTTSRRAFWIVMTLIVLVAAAGCVVYFWYLPSRHTDTSESELAARNLVRQAMIALDKAYVDAQSFDPKAIPPSTLQAIAPAITFHPTSDTSAATSPTAQAGEHAVNYAGTQTTYAVGTLSEAGTAYGVVVDKQANTVTYYLQGRQVASWEQTAATTTTGAGGSETTQTTPESPTTTQTAHSQIGAISAAADVEAMTLLRNAMTVVESAYASVNTFDPSVMTAQMLHQLEPTTTFVVREGDDAATAPEALAGDLSVDFFGTATSYALGTTSTSGTTFGVVVTKDTSGRTTSYYVNGQAEDWGSQLTGQ